MQCAETVSMSGKYGHNEIMPHYHNEIKQFLKQQYFTVTSTSSLGLTI